MTARIENKKAKSEPIEFPEATEVEDSDEE